MAAGAVTSTVAPPSVAPDEPAAFAAFTDACFAAAGSASSRSAGTFVLAPGVPGVRLRVRLVGDVDGGYFTDALAHRADAGPLPTGARTLTVWVVDGRTSGVRLPRPFWNWARLLPDGTVPDLPAATGYAHFQQDGELFTLLDPSAGRALVWASDVRRLPEWDRSFPFRMLLHRWLEPTDDYVLVHAGAVGRPDGGVLLAGRGGAGKSTSTLACVGRGLGYAGDDFVLVDAGRRHAHNLYNVAKIDAGNLGRFPEWAPHVANRASLPAQKAQVFVHRHRPDAVSAGFPIRAVLLPRFTGGAGTAIRPASPTEALHALAPTTLALLRADGRTLARMSRLVRAVPAFWIETGTDLPRIPEAVLALLDRLPAASPDVPDAA